MKKFTGHTEPWGSFVDVKVNAVELLGKEIRKKKPAEVWVSGVCDPYQPLEEKYRLTRECLRILLQHGWPVRIQTKSPLVLRDLDILTGEKGRGRRVGMGLKGQGESEFLDHEGPREGAARDGRSPYDCHVGFSIGTADEDKRQLFEPKAPPILHRVAALRQLHEAGVQTYVMIAPLLPGAETLPVLLQGIVDYAYVDRMNYGYADAIYRKHRLEAYRTESYFREAARKIKQQFDALGVPCSVFFPWEG